jgi:hypothetical protein
MSIIPNRPIMGIKAKNSTLYYFLFVSSFNYERFIF